MQYFKHDYLVPWDGQWEIGGCLTKAANDGAKKEKKRLRSVQKELVEYQKKLYAERKQSLLIVFQAMDAAGKDGTIRAVFSGINPQGCQVSSFKRPTKEELAHDYLWRVHQKTPAKGMIGIFNRSHYEEVLITSIFPSILKHQQLPERSLEEEFRLRYQSLRNFEQQLAQTGTRVIKFWLNISKAEQKTRLLRRMEDPTRYWKHEQADLDMRQRWDEFMGAYSRTLKETSVAGAPWYAIPADDKPYMRRVVAEIVLGTLKQMDPQYPDVTREEIEQIHRDKESLLNDQ